MVLVIIGARKHYGDYMAFGFHERPQSHWKNTHASGIIKSLRSHCKMHGFGIIKAQDRRKYTVLPFKRSQSHVKYMAFGIVKARKRCKFTRYRDCRRPPLDIRLWHMVIWTSAFGIW